MNADEGTRGSDETMKLTQKPELRFDDDNVVFQAQDIVFRVYVFTKVFYAGSRPSSKTCSLFLNLTPLKRHMMDVLS